MQLGVVPSAFSVKTQTEVQASGSSPVCSARPFPAVQVTRKPSESCCTSSNVQHKTTSRFSSRMRQVLTLKALSDSMESRSPSKGIRSRLYCSRWMKEPSTPCSFSHCSQRRLRRGTNRMWKSLCGERPLSSLGKAQQERSTRSLTAHGSSTNHGQGALDSHETGTLHWVIAKFQLLSVSVQPCAATALTPGQGDVVVLQFPKGTAIQA